MIHHGDCLEVVAGMESESVDAIVTDPPYGLGFMGKEWDALPPGLPWAEQCLRVLKPGGHLLAFGGSRTYHRLAVAVEDAGFEIRDQIMWLYGSGFPKSHDVSKAIDRAAGAEREIVRERTYALTDGGGYSGNLNTSKPRSESAEITAPATEQARKWSGWGTALKPAHEPVVVARKPLIGTVAQNVERFGVGGLNIDGCRVGTEESVSRLMVRPSGDSFVGSGQRSSGETASATGRWPANLVLDEQAGAMLDAQSGEQRSGTAVQRNGGGQAIFGGINGSTNAAGERPDAGYGDTGGASRFFYTAKASRAERNAGLDGFEERESGALVATTKGQLKDLRCGDDYERPIPVRANVHPTVKPIDLMRWLVRLVTPPGGTVLDPFTGSGTTGIAAGLEGFGFIGIEREAEYLAIAEARIAWWGDKHGDTADILVANGLAEKAKAEHVERGQLDLLGEAA